MRLYLENFGSPVHTEINTKRNARNNPQKHHQRRKACAVFALPDIVYLGNQLNAPTYSGNTTEEGCYNLRCHYFSTVKKLSYSS